jgi:hypothetical protein
MEATRMTKVEPLHSKYLLCLSHLLDAIFHQINETAVFLCADFIFLKSFSE